MLEITHCDYDVGLVNFRSESAEAEFLEKREMLDYPQHFLVDTKECSC